MCRDAASRNPARGGSCACREHQDLPISSHSQANPSNRFSDILKDYTDPTSVINDMHEGGYQIHNTMARVLCVCR